MFNWRQSIGDPANPGADGTAPGEQASPGLARVLGKIRKLEGRSEILDLGSLCGPTAVALASTGARVCVEAFVPPVPTDDDEPVPLRLPHDDDRFDLVLAWEHFDFVPPDRLQEFTREIHRVLAPGGAALLFAQDNPSMKPATPDRPGQYLLTGGDKIVRAPSSCPERPRWAHPNRAIERSLSPLSLEGIHLVKNRIREVIAQKKKADKKTD